MTSVLENVAIDCADAYELARFWSAVTGCPVHPDARPGDHETQVMLSDGPVLYFNQVPEPKTVKNRLHLCLRPTTSREAEVERLLGLGASFVADRRQPDGAGWAVLADPEGNEFCVLRSASERAERAAMSGAGSVTSIGSVEGEEGESVAGGGSVARADYGALADLGSLPTAEFAFPGPLRDRLVAAILDGAKTSTTGLVVDYEHEGEALPAVGDRSVVVDSDERPVAVIEVTGVRVVPLADVDLAHVVDEGEGHTSVAEWREAHERFWHSEEMRAALGDPGFTVDDTTPAVLERFRLVADLRPDRLRPDRLRPDRLRPDDLRPDHLRPDGPRPDHPRPDHLRPAEPRHT